MKRAFLYLGYLWQHKVAVFRAGRRTGAPLWRLIIHDWSKFLPSEWFPYLHAFYGKSMQEKEAELIRVYRETTPRWVGQSEAQMVVQDHLTYWLEQRRAAFDVARLKHQHRNPHHWQHWLLKQDDGEFRAVQMPDHFVREMVADWMGAGFAQNGRWEVAEWYAMNRDNMILHYEIRAQVEMLIELHGDMT